MGYIIFDDTYFSLMKIFFFSFILNLSFTFCFAQQNEKENLWKGTGKFILGAEISDFISDTNLLPNRNGFDSTKIIEGSYYYDYQQTKSNIFMFGTVYFKKIYLYFKNNKVLNHFTFYTNYSKKDSANYLKLAEDDIEKLAFYLKRKLKRKGVKRYSDNRKNSASISYEWMKNEFTIGISVVQGKIIGSEFANIMVTFSKKE